MCDYCDLKGGTINGCIESSESSFMTKDWRDLNYVRINLIKTTNEIIEHPYLKQRLEPNKYYLQFESGKVKFVQINNCPQCGRELNG